MLAGAILPALLWIALVPIAHAATPGTLPRSPLLGVPGGPTLAAEDTIPIPSALLPEYLVTAPRVSLDEILKRVAEGEARRDSMMVDQTYTMIARITYLDADGKAPTGARKKLEYASKVYKKHPNKVREIPLLQTSDVNKKQGDDNVNVSSSRGMREQIVSFAFEPRTRTKYRFKIDDRKVVGGHVVYVISFTPKSKFDDLPEGRVWVDTNDFVIAREEFWYRDRSPAPLVFKSIDSCVLERTKVDGKWWVMSRMLARVQVTSAARMMARLAKEPLSPTVDFVASLSDWKINQGIDDAVFAAAERK
jgi:outer membrane lipoprotein-sorting protein